jgi:hypothetical protein
MGWQWEKLRGEGKCKKRFNKTDLKMFAVFYVIHSII